MSVSHRLFFALWPPDATRQAIQSSTAEWVARSRGRAIPSANFHITLIFLGNVPDAEVAGLKKLAAAVRGSAFELQLTRLECWPKSRVLCAVAASSPPQLSALRETLMPSLSPEQQARENRPFLPHVTLARNVPRGPRSAVDIQPIEWLVEDFVLVESHTMPGGSQYEVLERWRLSGCDRAAGLRPSPE